MKLFFTTLITFFCSLTLAIGQEGNSAPSDFSLQHFFSTDTDYQIRAFFGIGGSAPLGIPREIRAIKSYNPGLQLGLEANMTKWLSPEKKWGIRLGVGVRSRGMKTEAQVKDYLTEIIQDQSSVRGYYTGKVKTHIKNTYVTIPISAVYQLSSQWNLYGGAYFSFKIDQQFDGYVSEGYLRQGSPVGEKIAFEDGSRAAYDFSDEVRTFQWGLQLGAEYALTEHFILFPQISYGFNGVLHDGFDAISFNLHNIYLDLGFGYRF